MLSLRIAAIGATVTVVALLAGAQAPAVAASATASEASTPHPAIAPASQRAASPLTLNSAAAVCNFSTVGDNVHVSGSAFEASGHGWWENINCSASKAVVTVQLQEYFSDGTWRNKGTAGKKTVYSGGGSANRAVGRAACNNATTVSWRSVVDVDLVGLADSSEKLTTSARNIACLRN